MAEIVLKNVTKEYEKGAVALKDVSLTVKDHEFLVLLGPSGCGKSTMLRVISGLDRAIDGEVYFDGVLMNDEEPMKRNVSMVFQSFALYPHLNVYKNLAFPLKSIRVPYPEDGKKHPFRSKKGMKLPDEEVKRRVEETAEILDITHILNRRPRALSGGQRQRVALGRAMVREPVVFLLDEPLSNLDVKMRQDLRNEIIRLHEHLKTTFIYVTHDQSEAQHLGDRVVVMDEGRIVQVGTPQEVYDYPNCLYVAGFVGAPKMNFFPCLLRRNAEGWAVRVMGAELSIPAERLSPEDPALVEGMKVVVGLRPESISLCEEGEEPDFTASVTRVVPMGANLHVDAECNGKRFTTVLQNHADVRPGSELRLKADRWCLHVFDTVDERALCAPVYKEESKAASAAESEV